MSAAFPDSSKVNGPAASRRWQAVQRAICRLAVVAAALMLGAAPVRADYNNPTSSADCNIYSNQYPFMGRKRALDQRISQCLSQARSASWVRIPACGYPADPRCAPLESQKCQLENQMRGIREMCMVKLQAFEAKARARRIAEEQAARERKRAEQEAMADRRKYRDETIRRTITPGGIDRDLKPGGNLTQALNAGRVVAGKFAGLQLSKPGALHLSAALSAESLRIAEAIQTTALERFRETMAQFAKDNPSFEANFGKPTPGRLQALDAQLNQLRALEGQVKHAAAALQHGLPVGGESAVIGEDAERLTQIAQAMADGTLKTPLFDTPASAAVTEIERHRAIERRRAERREKNPDIFKDVSKGLSGGRRFYRGALAHVIKENTRKRQEALRRREAAAAAAAQRKLNANREKQQPAAQCIHIYPRPGASAQKIFYNSCSKTVFLKCPGKDGGIFSAYPGRETVLHVSQCREYSASAESGYRQMYPPKQKNNTRTYSDYENAICVQRTGRGCGR